MGMLDNLLADLRSYAAQRDGITPFAQRWPSPAAPSASDLPVSMVPGGIPEENAAQNAAYFSGAMTGSMPPGFNTDPYASADAALAAERRSTLAPQSPVPFAGMLNNTTGVLSPDFASPASPAPVAAATPPSSPFDTSTSAVPFAQMSRDLATPPTTTISARRAVPARVAAAPAAGLPGDAPGKDFLSRISNGLANHSNLLLAMGAGLAGDHSFGEGMSRAFAAAIPAGQQDLQNSIRMQGIRGTYQSLVSQGVSPRDALAAVYNPDVFKAMIPRIYGKTPTWGQIGHDQYGNPIYGFIDTADQTVLPANKITVPQVKTVEQAMRLPKGSHFIDPNGVMRVR